MQWYFYSISMIFKGVNLCFDLYSPLIPWYVLYARSPITSPPPPPPTMWGENMYTPYLGYWYPLAFFFNTPHPPPPPGFLGKRNAQKCPSFMSFPRKSDHACAAQNGAFDWEPGIYHAFNDNDGTFTANIIMVSLWYFCCTGILNFVSVEPYSACYICVVLFMVQWRYIQCTYNESVQNDHRILDYTVALITLIGFKQTIFYSWPNDQVYHRVFWGIDITFIIEYYIIIYDGGIELLFYIEIHIAP